MRGEIDTLLFYLAKLCERKDLKSAAVREYGPVPSGELMESAEFFHKLVARAQMQMIGVAKLNLTVDILESYDETAPLIAPQVATFIKAGVCTVPWTVSNTPRRAVPSFFITVNFIFFPFGRCLFNEHGIAKTEKSIFFPNRNFVRIHRVFISQKAETSIISVLSGR